MAIFTDCSSALDSRAGSHYDIMDFLDLFFILEAGCVSSTSVSTTSQSVIQVDSESYQRTLELLLEFGQHV